MTAVHRTASEVEPDRLMTIEQVAEYTQLPKNTLYRMRSQGNGPRAARLGKHLRYRKSDVDAWIGSCLDEGEPDRRRR